LQFCIHRGTEALRGKTDDAGKRHEHLVADGGREHAEGLVLVPHFFQLLKMSHVADKQHDALSAVMDQGLGAQGPTKFFTVHPCL
jgi:hypothetical protein